MEQCAQTCDRTSKFSRTKKVDFTDPDPGAICHVRVHFVSSSSSQLCEQPTRRCSLAVVWSDAIIQRRYCDLHHSTTFVYFLIAIVACQARKSTPFSPVRAAGFVSFRR